MKRLRHQCYILARRVSGAFITTFLTDNQETTRPASLKDNLIMPQETTRLASLNSNHMLPQETTRLASLKDNHILPQETTRPASLKSNLILYQETTRLASLKDKILSNHTLPLIFLSKRYLGVIPYFATLFRRTSHQLSAASFLYSR